MGCNEEKMKTKTRFKKLIIVCGRCKKTSLNSVWCIIPTQSFYACDMKGEFISLRFCHADF